MIVGLTLFIGLIAYTSIYMAPPAINRSITDPITHRWIIDDSIAKSKAELMYNELLNRINDSSQNKSTNNESLTNTTNINYTHDIFNDALQYEILKKFKEEEIHLSNHPHASLIETVEEYILSTIHIISSPNIYINCLDCLKSIADVI